eukprot:maker-scaffold429_size173697-snap-gene-0.32 protein:Tk09735 transcript:maker-scaffold429_size173697-snap-gene-0.32-mRNA-1 annotation:"hypothetical protein KGM_04049"
MGDYEEPASVRNHRLSSIIEEDDYRSHVSSPNPKPITGRLNGITPEPDMENPLEAALAAIDDLARDEDFQDVDKENEDTSNTRANRNRLHTILEGSQPPIKDGFGDKRFRRSLSASSDSDKEFEMNEEHCEDPEKEPEEEDEEEEPQPAFKERIITPRRSQSPALRPATINPLEEIPIGPSAIRPHYNIIEPSSNAQSDGNLLPCPTCSRTFLRPALERHVKICEKVKFKQRNVFDVAKKRSEGNPVSPKPLSERPLKKKSVKPEDDLKECPQCHRKFGHKPYDRHVQWCEEKSLRLQDSPNKDLVALAKLQARTNYRPRTPAKYKEGSPSRKVSVSSMTRDSPLPSEFDRCSVGRSDSRNSRRSSAERKISNISYLATTDHTVETPETHFIRAVTGRGSIKRGPAPTKASQLRQLVKQQEQEDHEDNCPIYQKTPVTPTQSYDPLRSRASYVPRTTMAAGPGMSQSMYGPPPSTPGSIRRQTQSPMSNSMYNGMGSRTPTTLRRRSSSPMGRSTMSPSAYAFQPVVKPSVVRPVHENLMEMSQRGSYRRDPEGIDSCTEKTLGTYDHSKEYDPYQSAAKQMQELLFGTTTTQPVGPQTNGNTSSALDHLRPSSNSAFQKYVPSTSDINTKLNSKPSFEGNVSPLKSNVKPLSSSSALFSPNAISNGGSGLVPNEAPRVANSANGTRGNPKSPKVARFCHECGNPFALPNIRFCCECGTSEPTYSSSDKPTYSSSDKPTYSSSDKPTHSAIPGPRHWAGLTEYVTLRL